MAYDSIYYEDKKKVLADRLMGKKDGFINKIFAAAQELAKEQQDISADFQEVLKREEESKPKEEKKEEKKVDAPLKK